MKVFKFGGASVKDADAVRNMAGIVRLFPDDQLIIIVSAMGKTTNALERLTDAFFFRKEDPVAVLDEIKKFHFDIVNNLFPDPKHPLHDELHNTFVELDWAIEDSPTHSYDQEYDQIVCMGEIISTKIVAAFLNESKIPVSWRDVRDFIKTDDTWREGGVDWALTEQHVNELLLPSLQNKQDRIIVTQGFLGGTSENFTTTLGREGSDYTAAIMAWCTNAESVTIWKDVPGVLNADPKWFDDTQLIGQMSYQDAIELSYYGATVIHPKTLKPLQNKNIPLYVRSFVQPAEPGTRICGEPAPLPIPCFIFKVNQVLISISPKDFSFIVEENLSDIFELFAEQRVKVNVMLNSAISFSLSVDNDPRKLAPLIEKLRENFRVLYNENVELVTIRYYDQATLDRVTAGKQVFLEVKSRYTVQMVMKNA